MRAAAVFLLLMAGCTTTPAPRPGAYYLDDGPPEAVPVDMATVPDAVPVDEPLHRFANRPYTVFGRTYVPVTDRATPKERGIASWYGKKFHGQKTASGEVYDMFRMTAAHKTLPLPSYARVTNVRTGQSVVVRVNDRGPFHESRVIDLSYAAAQRLGFAQAGSALVEVERVFSGDVPAPGTASAPGATASMQATPLSPHADAGIWLQVGAFSSADAAESFRVRTARAHPWLLEPFTVALREGLHRVRLGPYRNREEAQAIAEKLRQSGIAPVLAPR